MQMPHYMHTTSIANLVPNVVGKDYTNMCYEKHQCPHMIEIAIFNLVVSLQTSYIAIHYLV